MELTTGSTIKVTSGVYRDLTGRVESINTDEYGTEVVFGLDEQNDPNFVRSLFGRGGAGHIHVDIDEVQAV